VISCDCKCALTRPLILATHITSPFKNRPLTISKPLIGTLWRRRSLLPSPTLHTSSRWIVGLTISWTNRTLHLPSSTKTYAQLMKISCRKVIQCRCPHVHSEGRGKSLGLAEDMYIHIKELHHNLCLPRPTFGHVLMP